MITFIEHKRPSFLFRVISCFIVATFVVSSIIPPTPGMAQVINPAVLSLPIPGEMVALTNGYQPSMIKGMITHPDNPLEFDFIVDQGEASLSGEAFNEESRKMIKYFLASLTTPEEEMWVNLSPYESNRIIPTDLGQTEMGRDLLAQDYILKQLTASLMYPEEKVGGEFWKRVHRKAQALYGTTDIPMNTFNKIWIVPDKATIYQKGASAFILENHLKVMLEEDYVALKANLGNKLFGTDQVTEQQAEVISGVTSQLVKEVLIPEIEYEVNNGRHFAKLRQIANAMVLATWYKQNLKESLLSYVYVDQNKTKGIDVTDKEIKQKIYNQYVKAFKRGVYSYIKEETDPTTQQVIPRKYFSGGFESRYRSITQVIDADRGIVSPRVQGLVRDQVTGTSDGAMLVNINLIDAGRLADTDTLRQLESYTQKSSVDLTLGRERLSLRVKPIQGADAAMLAMDLRSTFQDLTPQIAEIIQKQLLRGSETRPGIASIASRDAYEFTDKSEVQDTIKNRIRDLFRSIPIVDSIYIDGELVDSGRGGELVVRATSLDSAFNLSTGTANGTSFEIYDREGQVLNIRSNGRILWGTRQRVTISDGTKTQDYVLTESNELIEVEKYTDNGDNTLTVAEDGKTFAFGGFTKDQPVGVQAFMRDVMPTISGAKNRNAEALTPDSYLIANKNGMMANWMTWGEAHGLAQFYEASGASVMVMTNQGMRNVSDIPLTERQLASLDQVYVYAGSKNLVNRIANFLDARPREYQQNARTKRRQAPASMAHTSYKESFSDYLRDSVNVPASAGVDARTAADLKQRALKLANAVIATYLDPTPLNAQQSDALQQEIVQELADKLPGAVTDDQQFLNSMRGVLRGYQKNPDQEKIENNSGDLQHPLDFSFDRLINYTLRQNGVSAIISEEVADIVPGIGPQDINTYRLVAFSDPIDGSSQIEDAGAFGSIIGIGFLKPGETLEDGDFDPRSRFLFGFDLGYSTGTTIGFFNLSNSKGKPEVVQFGLTERADKTLEFRKEFTFDNLIDVELQQEFARNGLLPAINTENPEDSALHLALGGALADSAPQYRVFMEGLIERYGMVPQYTGALQIDEKRLSTVSKFANAAGVGYFYPTQYTRDRDTGELKGTQKLRLFFEGYYYAVKRKAMGAEVLNGDTVAPLLNDRARGTSPSGQKASIMSGSSWIMKMYMTWVDHLERSTDRLGPIDTAPETALIAEFNQFVTDYVANTSDLILSLREESLQEGRREKTTTEIRRALLTYDSTGKRQNYFPRFFDIPAARVYDQLYGSDRAMLADTPVKTAVQDLSRQIGPEIVNAMQEIYGKTAQEAAALRATNKFARIGFEDQNNRMGWGLPHVKEIVSNPTLLDQTLADAGDIRENFDDVIFIGMGGSGLTVATTTTTFGQPRDVRIHSLRTTDRDAIYALLDNISKDRGVSIDQALNRTKIIVVTKSRTTRETLDNKDYFEGFFDQYGIDKKAKRSFMFISDPKTAEQDLPYTDAGYELRNIQLNAGTDIGGRYTAPTTNIALLPLAIINPDLVRPYLQEAVRMNDIKNPQLDTFLNLGIYLQYMATQRGKDKITFLVPKELQDLPIWSEQLIEESLGKGGKGITVVFGEELTQERINSPLRRDRVFVRFNIAGQKTRPDLADVLDGADDVFDVDIDSTTQLGGVFLGLQRAVQTVAYRWSDKLGDLNGVRQDAVEGYKRATNAEMDALNVINARKVLAELDLAEVQAVYTDLGLAAPSSGITAQSDIDKNKPLADAFSKIAIARNIGEDIQMPAKWKYGSFESLRVYYTPFIEAGVTTQDALEAEVQRLGSTLDDGVAVYAALTNIAQRNGLTNPDGGLFELSELASFGRMTDDFKGMMQRVRTNIFTDKLKVASKLNERPDGNHAFHQSVEDGPNYHLSTFLIPFGITPTEYPEYGYNLIRAQGIGTSNALINVGRKVIPIRLDGTTADSVDTVENFFKAVQARVTAYADAAVLAVATEVELQGLAISIDQILRQVRDSDQDLYAVILEALRESDQNKAARASVALGLVEYRINARQLISILASQLDISAYDLSSAFSKSENRQIQQLGLNAFSARIPGLVQPEVPKVVRTGLVRDSIVRELPADQTVTAEDKDFTRGGIDLNPQLLDLQIKRDDSGIPLPVNQQPINNMTIDGFIPIIINVTPVSNLPLLLGLADTADDVPGEVGYNLFPGDKKARFEIEDVEVS